MNNSIKTREDMNGRKNKKDVYRVREMGGKKDMRCEVKKLKLIKVRKKERKKERKKGRKKERKKERRKEIDLRFQRNNQ